MIVSCNKYFRYAFEPTRIGNVEIKNRIVMSAMGTGFADPKGFITSRSIHYYTERARGGVGLIIVEGSNVHQFGHSYLLQPNIYDDRFIPGFKELTDAVHRNSSKVGLQLIFSGIPALTHTSRLPAPSKLGSKARELSKEEIQEIIKSFGEAAQRARTAGFDLIEIHACHGSLVCLFLSPKYNRRIDEYGGNGGRALFAIEILTSIKEKTSHDFPVIFRINGEEYTDEQGMTIKEASRISKILEKFGVDALNITSGIETRDAPQVFASSIVPQGFRVHLAAQIKKDIHIPVITSGGINNFRMLEEILQNQHADLVAMGKSLIADPYLPKKAREGRLDDIRPCVRCCEGCAGNILGGQAINCIGNAEVGRENDFRINQAKKKKKVLILGGGPAGMEAARVSVLRGYAVFLYEKSQKLGGQLFLAAIPPYKKELGKLVDYLAKQIDKLGVHVELGKLMTLKEIEYLKPDVVIMATGAKPFFPPIDGIDGTNVVSALDVLGGKEKTGKEVLVIGGGQVGCETAEFLADQGKNVKIVEMLDELARDLNFIPHRKLLIKRLKEKGVGVLMGTKVKACTPKGIVTLKGVFGVPPEEEMSAESIVIAAGSVPDQEMIEKLKDKFQEFYMIGDCVDPRNALEAIHEGSQIARLI